MNTPLALLMGTFFFIFISRKSILKTDSHGFFRFFIFECLLIQILIDINNPVKHHAHLVLRVLTDMFFNASLLLAAVGFWMLRKRGRPDSTRNDNPMLEFEKTTNLVTEGIYGYIRHPMYGALFLLSWGFFLKDLSLTMAILALTASIFVIATIKVEEEENIKYFGSPYLDYMKKTKRFLPFVF